MASSPVTANVQPVGEKPAETLSEHTLPARWWVSDSVFEFEKRAIFNKSWLFCTHSSRFEKPGDYYRFSFTGISFFIIKSKVDGQIKAFHNVCRHRAFPVIRKDKGSSVVLGCKYHGWSYNSDGKLTKAPHFDQVEGFEKEQNSLFPIRTHVTRHGLVFVNFSNEKDVTPFEEWYEGLESEMDAFDFSDYEYHMSYELDGQFNWKTLIDGYQECYHCPTAHPGLNSAFRMETYDVVPKTRYCRHYAEIVRNDQDETVEEELSWMGFRKQKSRKKISQKANPGGDFDGLWVYLFPTNGVNCYSPAWYSIRVLPQSATHTILQYDIYTKKGLDETTKTEFVDFLQKVELEDFDLCQFTQRNLNQGIYTAGYLHPTKERGVLYYQKLVGDMVRKHLELENKEKRQINPAAVAPTNAATNAASKLEDICSQIDCQGGNNTPELW